MQAQLQREKMNIHQKILKIADMAGVLRKDKQAYGYKYTPEDAIQAKITAGMQKYGVNLMPTIVPGTLEVIPYHYEKVKQKKVKNDKGKEELVDYTVPVNEVIVKAEVEYIWTNADNPEEKVICRWAYIGQMDDASQAFGAGATYGNRYYLIKALQLATTEDDPDNYRSKQKEAEDYEDKKAKEELSKAIKELNSLGSELVKLGVTGEELHKIVAKYNDNNENLSAVRSMTICDEIRTAFTKLKEELQAKQTEKKGE